MTTKSDYPEHDKMRAVKDHSQTVGDFIEWLMANGLSICEYDVDYRQGTYFPTPKSTRQLLADFFEIDLKKVDEEKDAMVEEMRRQHAETE